MMRELTSRVTMALAVVVVLFATTLSVMAQREEAAAVKGQKVSITGRLACTCCTLEHPSAPCANGCCTNCLKSGDPPMLIDSKGDMYVLTSVKSQHPLMTSERQGMAGKMVTVGGTLVKGKGVQAIFVSSVQLAK